MSLLQDRADLVDHVWNTRGWIIRFAILCAVGAAIWAMGLFLKWPLDFLSLVHFPRLEDFLKLCANPLARDLNEPIVAYRITVPVMSHLLGLDAGASVFVGWVALAASYAVCWMAMRRYCGSWFAVVIVFSLSQTFFAHSSIRWLGIPDSVTLLALAVCLAWTSPWVVGLASVLGILNDERFLLGAPAILIWHAVAHSSREGAPALPAPTWRPLALGRVLLPVAAGLLAGLAVVYVVRHGLTTGWIGEGIERPGVYDQIATQPVRAGGWQPYGSNWPLFFFNVVFSWAWLWFYPLYLLLRGLPRIGLFLAVACGGYLLAAMASASLVVDVSRSMGFLFPLFLAGALTLHEANQAKALRIASVLAILAAVTPGIYYGTHGSGAVFLPYPVDALNNFSEEILGVDVLNKLKSYFSFKGAFDG